MAIEKVRPFDSPYEGLGCFKYFFIILNKLQFWSGLEIAWIDILSGLWFTFFGVIFIVFCGVYRSQEWDRVQIIVEAIEAGEVKDNRPNFNVGQKKEDNENRA